MSKNLELNLFDNAFDSLNESLVKYKQGQNGDTKAYKFCILHLSHFLELIFKYYVYKAHPLLIYKNPFADKINEKSYTITLNDAVNFLKNEKRELDKDFETDIDWLKKLRNNIEHYQFKMSIDEVENVIGRLMSSLTKFDESHDNIDILGNISKDHYFLFFNLAYNYEERLAKAIEKTDEYAYHPKHNPENLVFECEECGNQTMIPDDDSKSGFKCSFCGSDDSEYIEMSCGHCGETWQKWQMTRINLEDYYDPDVGATGVEYWCPRCSGDPDYI